MQEICQLHFNILHISQFKDRADKINKSLLQAAFFLSATIKLFFGSGFSFSSCKELLNHYSLSLLIPKGFFSLDKYRQGHAKWSPALLIQPKHWGAAGKFDYAYIRKIPNGLSVASPHSFQLYCRGLNGLRHFSVSVPLNVSWLQ